MENYCYWQENIPNIKNNLLFQEKFCLLRLNEYEIEKENKGTSKINIICPYKNKEEALSCFDYSLIKDIK